MTTVRTRLRRTTGLLAVAAVVGTSACTAGPGAPEADGAGDPAATSAAAVSTRPGEQAQPAPASPLDAYEDVLLGGVDVDRARADQNRVEELAAACMQEQGFTYVPLDHVAILEGQVERDLTSAEGIAQYGYGYSMSPEQLAAEQAAAATSTFGPDPNYAYRESLSEAQRVAYDAALHGDPDNGTVPDAEGRYEYEWARGGCMGAAQHEVSPEPPDDPARDALVEAYLELYTAESEHPDVLAADRDWAACMSRSGHQGLDTRADADQRAMDAWTAVVDRGQDLSEVTDLGEIHRAEVELALADHSCGEEVGYAGTVGRVRLALETEFVERNRAELDALASRGGQGG